MFFSAKFIVANPPSGFLSMLMGYKRSLVDTCKSSNVLIVSTLVVFVLLAMFFCINKLCNEELSLLHIMTRNYS